MRSTKWMWLPLSLGVLINYIFARGLVVFSKTGLTPPELKIGLVYYFIIGGIIAAFIGIVCDKFNIRKIFLLSCIAGFLGLLLIPYSPLGFGILFGASAAMARLGPFSAPMKLIDRNAGINISPQAVGKSLASIILPLLFTGILLSLGWGMSMAILATIYLLVGIWIWNAMPDDYVEGWNLKAIPKWFKNWEILFFITAQTVMTVCWALGSRSLIPAFTEIGYTAMSAAAMVSLLAWAELSARFPAGWAGDKFGYRWIYLCTLFMIPAAFLIRLSPIVMGAVFLFAGGLQTPVMFPYARQLVGKEHVGTLMGLALVCQYIATGVIIGF